MAFEAAQAIVRQFCNVSDAKLSNADINWLHRNIVSRSAALESELAALRQIVADVETCRSVSGYFRDSVEIFADNNCRPLRATVRANDGKYHHAPTWQAALHAAAEHVRNTNPERNDP